MPENKSERIASFLNDLAIQDAQKKLVESTERLERALVKLRGELEKVEDAYGENSDQAIKARGAIDNLTSKLEGQAKAYDFLASEQKKWASTFSDALTKIDSFISKTSKAAESIISLGREQAVFISSLKQTAQQLNLSGGAFDKNIQSLRHMQSTLKMTRDQLVDFSSTIRKAMASGLSTDQIEKMTKQLQNLRGPEVGRSIMVKSQALGISSDDLLTAQTGSLQEYVAALRRQSSAEQADVLAEFRRSSRAQAGRGEKFLGAEASNKAAADSIRETLGEGAMYPGEKILSANIPAIASATQKTAQLLQEILAISLAANVGGAVFGGGRGGAGLGGLGALGAIGLGGKGKAGVTAAGRAMRVGGKLTLAGLVFEAIGMGLDYGASQIGDEGAKKSLETSAKMARVGGYTATGAGLGALMGSVPGAFIGGALGGAYGLYSEFGQSSGEGNEKRKMSPEEIALEGHMYAARARQTQAGNIVAGAEFGPAQERGRLAGTQMEQLMLGGFSGARAQELMTARAEGQRAKTDTIELGLKSMERKIKQDIAAVESDIAKARREGKPEFAEALEASKGFMQQSLIATIKARTDNFTDALKVMTDNIEFNAKRIKESGEFLEAEARHEQVGVLIERGAMMGMGRPETEALYGRRLEESKGNLARLEKGLPERRAANEKARAEEIAKAPPEQRATIEEKYRIADLKLVTEVEKQRNQVLKESLEKIKASISVETRRLDVQKNVQEAQLRVAQTLGYSYQSIFSLQQAIVETKSRELAKTKEEIAANKAKGVDEDAPEMQRLRSQEARQAADVFISSFGAQKSFIQEAMGEAFGTSGRMGTKFQPSVHERAIFGEHGTFGGMLFPGQVSPAQQRAGLRQGVMKGLMGGPQAGVGGPGLKSIPPEGLAKAEITLKLEMDTMMFKTSVASVVASGIQQNVNNGNLVAGHRGANIVVSV